MRKRKFIVTTDSHHQLCILSEPGGEHDFDRCQTAVGRQYHLHRLLLEFVFLAVILDASSRRGVGLALGRSLEAELTLAALRMALTAAGAGLVHHSDRGVRYVAGDYIAVLKNHGIEIRMSRRRNTFDNAISEFFFKTLKYEQVYREDYRVFEE